MMNEKDTTRISKFLSLVLRHQPETIGLVLDENGWADTAELIEKLNQHGAAVTQEIMQHVVATNNKKRFAFNDDESRIRANQGHSVEVELNLPQQVPPAILYHGTGEKSVASILENGLVKRERHHVHLSGDITTAKAVGQRHGKPAIFEVAALQMQQDGNTFYLSENGVWLVDTVPAKYLKLM
jgi:putative RNA 2'-phosphotransferase